MSNQAIVVGLIVAIILIWGGGAFFGMAAHRYEITRRILLNETILPASKDLNELHRDMRKECILSFVIAILGIAIIIYVITRFFST